VRTVKGFDDAFDACTTRRMHTSKPGHYTRIGTAVPHAARRLAKRPHVYWLLLLRTDGEPKNSDHYEDLYAVEDTHMTIREARRVGVHVFDGEQRGATTSPASSAHTALALGRRDEPWYSADTTARGVSTCSGLRSRDLGSIFLQLAPWLGVYVARH
jgi:hypothetical protein